MLLCTIVPAFAVPRTVEAAQERFLWEDILDALDALSPLIDDAAPGLAYADMRGINGDPAAWMQQARSILEAFDVPFRIGVGINKICARAAALIADGTVLDAGRERAALAPLSLELLDIEPGVRERLRLLGIATLGDLAKLPHGPFVRRFGPQSARWHDGSRGIDRSPFRPRGHSLAIEATLFGEGRVEEEEQVIFALRILLARIASDLERCGRRAGALRVELEFEDGESCALDIMLATPTAQERSMLDVVRAALEGRTFGAPIVGLRVQALRLEESGEELPLLCADDIDPERIAVTIARLEAALGHAVQRARTQPAHTLESQFTYDRFEVPKREVLRAETPSFQSDLIPQLRLLTVREIDVRLRAGEPAFVGEPPRAVLECAGPWRIDEGWFDGPIVRDEYDVLLDDGGLYRIYRQGTQWYVRGSYD